MVRSTGLRRSKDRDSRQMAPLAPVRKVGSKYGEGSLPAEHYLLPHFEDRARWSVRLNETYYLPIWLLDLAVLNADGRCSLTGGQEPSPLLVDPWRKRLPILIERGAAITATTNKITDASIDKGELLQSYCRIPLGSPFEVELTQGANGANTKWTLSVWFDAHKPGDGTPFDGVTDRIRGLFGPIGASARSDAAGQEVAPTRLVVVLRCIFSWWSAWPVPAYALMRTKRPSGKRCPTASADYSPQVVSARKPHFRRAPPAKRRSQQLRHGRPGRPGRWPHAAIW